MTVRSIPSITAGALAEQQHLIDEIENPGLAAAFEQLAIQHAPTATWAERNAHEKQLVEMHLAFTAPGTPGHERLFGRHA